MTTSISPSTPMSSDEDHNVCVPAKRRRVQRACDACRIKKRACDEVQNSGKKCSNCVENELHCTFGGAVAKRKSYVDVLEARLELTEQLLRKLSTQGVQTPRSSQWSRDSPVSDSKKDTSATSSVDPGIDLAALTIRSINAPPPAQQKDDLTHIDLAQELRGLSMNTHWDRFHGKASMALLARAAVHQRDACAHQAIQLKPRRMHYWTFDPTKDRRRHVGPYVFPEADLMFALVDNYFIHTNLYFPLLHRPTFERCIADKMHLRDESFGAVLLLVCAIGSRFSNDPRVCGPHDEPLRCGWKYFDQLPLAIDHLFVRPTLYHLQYHCLAVSFLEFSTPNACWTLVGLGIRIAQEVGAHRANAAGAAPTAESELWKRAFWVIVCYDRICSSMLGRPCTTQYEDFDVELPIECDDEFWETEDPAQAFKQPEGKPSQIAFFNCFVRLNNILAFSLKMLYSLNKTNNLLAARDEAWEEHIVAELDSALNTWVDAIPDHLRWDPDREEDNFFDQSALLYCTYYQVQMTIHRPFIPMVRKDASTALPSLAICTNAARSCSHVSDISTQRKNGTPVPVLLGATFTSALVLLLSIFSGKRIRLPPQLNSAMVEVHKCMASMRPCETRWQSAGLYWDMIYVLCGIPAPNHAGALVKMAHGGSKFGLEDDAAQHAPLTAEVAYFRPHTDPYPSSAAESETPFTALPTHTRELGRLPMFHPYAAETSWHAAQTAAVPPYPDLRVGANTAGGVYWTADFEADAGTMSSDARALWENAPTGFEVNDWSAYFSVMDANVGN